MQYWTVLYQRDNQERTIVDRITASGTIAAIDTFKANRKDEVGEVKFIALLEGQPKIWTTPPVGYAVNSLHPLDSMPSGF
jgi:hypothetical protein